MIEPLESYLGQSMVRRSGAALDFPTYFLPFLVPSADLPKAL
jgi:hypothetical protein